METIRTKFTPLVGARGLLDRPRLRAQIAEVESHRLTLVRAPAGYGKTSLLAQWFEDLKSRDCIACWLTLDKGEETANRLVRSLTVMLAREERIRRALRTEFCSPGKERSRTERSLAILIDDLARASGPVYVFLDDAHVISREATRELSALIRHAPLSTRFILATRKALNLELAAMRAYGHLFELGPTDLEWKAEEASALASVTGFRRLDASNLDVFVAKAEGWITGLKLACFSLGVEASPDAFSGRCRTVGEYFAENVYALENEAARKFMLETAVLDRLSPQGCDAITGRTDSQAMLRRLEAAGCFLFPEDQEECLYKYHRLFLDFLRQKLATRNVEQRRTLHRRAAQWMASEGRHEEALAHAEQTKDDTIVASILESAADTLVGAGETRVLKNYAARLSENILVRHPRTLLAVAWLHIVEMRPTKARHTLDIAWRLLQHSMTETAVDDPALDLLPEMIRQLEVMLAAGRDEVATVEELCADLMRPGALHRSLAYGTRYALLIAAQREQFRFDDLDRLHIQGRASAQMSGHRFAHVSLEAAAGTALFAVGRTEAATTALTRAMDQNCHSAEQNRALCALAALPLAEIAYEQNDLARAQELVDAYLPFARDLSFADQFVSGYITRSRLYAAKGDLSGARHALDEAMTIALGCDLERLRLAVLNEQVRLMLRDGRPEAAARQAEQAVQPACFLHSSATTKDELRAVIWSRIAISQTRIADALSMAKRWRSFCAHRGAVRALVRWNLLAAQALMVSGDARAAQRVLREAVAAAAPADIMRSFVDEGAIVLKILSDAYSDCAYSGHVLDLFANRILEAFSWKRPAAVGMNPAEEGLYGRLSGKELDILTLVGCGMRNREIGNRLGLSEGSVKWYMQQVYDKVGIRRRSQAVERARQFGLIA